MHTCVSDTDTLFLSGPATLYACMYACMHVYICHNTMLQDAFVASLYGPATLCACMHACMYTSVIHKMLQDILLPLCLILQHCMYVCTYVRTQCNVCVCPYAYIKAYSSSSHAYIHIYNSSHACIHTYIQSHDEKDSFRFSALNYSPVSAYMHIYTKSSIRCIM